MPDAMREATPAGPAAARGLLQRWLDRQLPPAAAAWLAETAARLAGPVADGEVYMAISLVGRRVGKMDLRLDAADLAAADRVRRGWDPGDWSVDQAARLVLLLAGADDAAFAARLEQLFVTADVGELVTFYRGLPLYPDPPAWLARAGEGARSNMRAVFEAVAHRNPYPREMFAEPAWNQLVLKALFIGAPLAPILGLEARQNPTLARMLGDYAHERWAAGRPVSAELWRCVGAYADAGAIADLARVLATGDAAERAAAVLALTAAGGDDAKRVLAAAPDLVAAVTAGRLTWSSLTPTS